MALTANITTPDGAEHPQAYGQVYPLTMQLIEGDTHIQLGLHVWHSETAKAAGASELSGYPETIILKDADAEQAIAAGLMPLAAIEWTGNSATDMPAAMSAVIAAIEDVVVSQRPQFQRVV